MIFNPVVVGKSGGNVETVTGTIPAASAFKQYSFCYTTSDDFTLKSYVNPSSQMTLNDIVKGSIFYIYGQEMQVNTKEVSGDVQEITDKTASISDNMSARFFVANGDFTITG